MDYTLAHGTANDFVVFADLDDNVEVSADFARALTDRRIGIGADGVLRLGADRDADVYMDHRNADGSTAMMCGNGVRVVAKYVIDHSLVPVADDGLVRVGTRSGIKLVRVVAWHDDGKVAQVEVDMGPPELTPAKVPFVADDENVVTHQIRLDDTVASRLAQAGYAVPEVVEFSVVSMGNPHAVLKVADVDAAPVEILGSWLETHPRFPEQVNVGFAEVVADDHLRLRVFERGVGETHACGTGACAAVVAMQQVGQVGETVAVDLPGGTLNIAHAASGPVMMTGSAVEVAHGTLDDAWLATARRGSAED